MEKFDVIIIGSGQGGDPLARECAKAGRKTALIERSHVGGTCINTGCTPTKTMVASARVAYLSRRAADYGVKTGAVDVDMSKVRARKRRVVQEFRQSGEEKDTHTPGLELIRAEARFTDSKTLAVAGRELTAETIVIDAGARPRIPPIPGLDQANHLDNESVMELDTVPEHLVVLGGGYIGVEFAQMFCRFGSRVTVIQKANQLVEREDEDVAGALADIFRQDGIEVLLGAEITKVEPGPAVTVKTGERTHKVKGSHLLVAIGRTPNSDRLDLPAAGIKTDPRGWIAVNEKLETNVPGVYAIGDVNGEPQFTHISYDDFRILKSNLLEGGAKTTRDRLVPYTAFTDPQLGRVGLSERQAIDQKVPHKIAKMPMESVARAYETSETRGFMKAVLSTESKQILGFAVLGIEGGEIMNMVQIAMMGKLPYTALRDGIFAHPTLGESLNNLFAKL